MPNELTLVTADVAIGNIKPVSSSFPPRRAAVMAGEEAEECRLPRGVEGGVGESGEAAVVVGGGVATPGDDYGRLSQRRGGR